MVFSKSISTSRTNFSSTKPKRTLSFKLTLWVLLEFDLVIEIPSNTLQKRIRMCWAIFYSVNIVVKLIIAFARVACTSSASFHSRPSYQLPLFARTSCLNINFIYINLNAFFVYLNDFHGNSRMVVYFDCHVPIESPPVRIWFHSVFLVPLVSLKNNHFFKLLKN